MYPSFHLKKNIFFSAVLFYFNPIHLHAQNVSKVKFTDNVQWTVNKEYNALSHPSPVKSNTYFIDSFKTYPYNRKRIRLVTAANIVAYGGTLIGLNAIWYAKYPRSSFHFFDDDKEWLQIDKVGHVYSAYTESKVTMEAWRWAGLPRKKSIWIGGLSGVAYQSIIEILDGFSSEYGFSSSDFAANLLGSGLFISQELAWNQQKIIPKFSFHKKIYTQQDLESRSDKLYGTSAIERMMKDYNGQSYWLSANIHSFFPKTEIPHWLNISVGYGAEGMFGGTENIGYDKDGNIIFDRTDVKRYRQWYLAPDIDFTQIKTNRKGVKILLFVLNSFKFPTPALEYSNGSFKGHWILF